MDIVNPTDVWVACVLSVETTGGPLGPVSRLRVKVASPSDSGNYSCSAPDADTSTVLIQVLDGESHILLFMVLVRKTELYEIIKLSCPLFCTLFTAVGVQCSTT